MTLEQLDSLRGYLIAAVILSVVATGLTNGAQARGVRAFRVFALSTGALSALGLFFILCFITGWDDYFAAKAAGTVHTEYQGRHQLAAQVISTLGELRASGLGLVFGAVGLVLSFAAFVVAKGLRRSSSIQGGSQ